MKIKTKNSLGTFEEYEVVEKIPSNFFVWNIGCNMGTEEYIPICENLHPEIKDDYNINQLTVKAIKLDREEVLKLRNAATRGIDCLAKADKALKSKRTGYEARKKKELAEMTIEIFRRISEQ